MNLETKITIYKFTPQLFTLTLENGSVLKFGPLTQNCKRLRDSILSPIFHSYIFAMYKNESLWI